MDGKRIVVVGAGVVGMAAACYLRREGHDVTVIDRLPPGRACSFGNGGAISGSALIPLSYPGVARKIPGWLFDPLGPLSFRLAHLPALLPWLGHFLAAGRPARFAKIVDAKAALAMACYDGWAPLIKDAGIENLVRHTGVIHVYRDKAAFAAESLPWQLRRERDLSFDELGSGELRQLVPGLSPDYTHAVFEGHWRYALDPYLIVTGLADYFRALGGRIVHEEVRGFEAGPEGVRRAITDRAWHVCDAVIIAAGAWSNRLSESLGDRVPLEAQRGYHVTIPQSGVELRHLLMDPNGKMGVTPMAPGLRVSGTSEFAGLDAAPNFARARVLITKARKIFPALKAEGFTEWAGDRPALPDTLPVIDRASRHANVFYAFGHSQLGLTLAGITGKLVAELVAGRPPSLNLAPYRVGRFRDHAA
ncbi:MAG: NAD(P)/FAD-dependent oxidoreductase [Alphaproteobacteria bacterium]